MLSEAGAMIVNPVIKDIFEQLRKEDEEIMVRVYKKFYAHPTK